MTDLFAPSQAMTGLSAGLSVFFLVLASFSKQKKSQLSRGEEENGIWLYSNLLETLYDLLFGKAEPLNVSRSLGLEADKYMRNCNIVGKTPNLKKECMMRLIGTVAFVLGLILSLVFFNLIPFGAGTLCFLLMVTRVTHQVQSAADEKKDALIRALPRFIDLFLSALEVHLPPDVAIIATANAVPCVASDELKQTFAEMKIGAKSWQQALEDIAHKYEVDAFSDFVLDIITAEKKGVSITESVRRQSYEIRQTTLLRAKEKTAKMSTTILIPVVIFKLLPLIIIMMLPIAIQILRTFG